MNKIKFENGSIEIKNQTEEKADMYFYGNIVSEECYRYCEEDQCPENVKKMLDEVKNVKNLDIYINSGGGSVFAGIAIYNMLKRNKAHKKVYVDGLAGSIASVIMMAGDEIIIPANAYLMIHKASTFVYGNADDLIKMATTLETIEEGIMSIYETRLKEGVKIEEIKQMLDEETWMTGKMAAEYFNIEVGEELKAVASVSDLKNYSKVPDNLIMKEMPKTQETTKNNVDSFFHIRKKLLNI